MRVDAGTSYGRPAPGSLVVRNSPAAGGRSRTFGLWLSLGTSKKKPDGRYEVAIGRAPWREIAERLAGWGDEVQVREPAEVRHHLAEIGTQLIPAYPG